jgi:hypothetical protein
MVLSDALSGSVIGGDIALWLCHAACSANYRTALSWSSIKCACKYGKNDNTRLFSAITKPISPSYFAASACAAGEAAGRW